MVDLSALDINSWNMDELEKIVDEFKKLEVEREISDRLMHKSSLTSLDRMESNGVARIVVRLTYERAKSEAVSNSVERSLFYQRFRPCRCGGSEAC